MDYTPPDYGRGPPIPPPPAPGAFGPPPPRERDYWLGILDNPWLAVHVAAGVIAVVGLAILAALVLAVTVFE